MPYFSYISMLHLYETLGWWRAGAELRKMCATNRPNASKFSLPVVLLYVISWYPVRGPAAESMVVPHLTSCSAVDRSHFAEEWNEMHHLQIMEALGGDRLWLDRWVLAVLCVGVQVLTEASWNDELKASCTRSAGFWRSMQRLCTTGC